MPESLYELAFEREKAATMLLVILVRAAFRSLLRVDDLPHTLFSLNIYTLEDCHGYHVFQPQAFQITKYTALHCNQIHDTAVVLFSFF